MSPSTSSPPAGNSRESQKDAPGLTTAPSGNRRILDQTETQKEARSSSAPEATRPRRKRQHFSCAECRRLKLKCDREVPCSNCIRRRCPNLCPNDSKDTPNEPAGLKKRLDALEALLSQNGITIPSSDAEMLRPSCHDKSVNGSAPKSRSPSPKRAPSDRSDREREMRDNRTSIMEREIASEGLTALTSTPALPQDRPSHFIGSQSSSDANPLSDVFIPPSPFREPHRVHFDYSHPDEQSAPSETHPDEQGIGTLMIGRSGRSKYLGPTAASEWLKDQEIEDGLESPSISRAPSPTRHFSDDYFPFDAPISMAFLTSKLPPLEEACVLVDAYFRYFAWHYDIILKPSFMLIFDKAYGRTVEKPSPQELSLVFMVMAQGALHNLELPPNDPISEDLFRGAKMALSKGKFLEHNTIAGVQALHLMAHFHLETERGRTGDSAWPLWGLSMRIIQGMGLHRDGEKWNLPPEIVEERRRVFWECFSADVFQANCFSRPSSISPEHIDTQFPSDEPIMSPDGIPHKGFKRLKFELSTISGEVLNLAMKVNAPSYQTVLDLHERLVSFERNIPFALRCRTALLSLSSIYPNSEAAIAESPEISKRDLQRTFQQFTLALNITESLLFLHRPYFARALHEQHSDPTRSQYGPSYLAVMERCNVIIQLAVTIHALHPYVVSRHWYFWYHAFSAAVCAGTVIMQNPKNVLAGFALSQIDSAITVYTSGVQSRASKRMVQNLQWLLRLKQRVQSRMNEPSTSSSIDSIEESDDIELLGWRTRLIQRASKGKQTATTITPTQINATPSPNTVVNQTITQALQQQFGAAEPHADNPPLNLYDTGNDPLLTQFWDPSILQDLPDTNNNLFNWWTWDISREGEQRGE